MFSKAIEIFITELSLRAWLHTEEAKRRTVQVIDRQTDRQTERQTYRQTDRQTDIQTDRQTDEQTDRLKLQQRLTIDMEAQTN